MTVHQTARIIADFVVFFELSDEEFVDEREANKMMEFLGYRLQSFEPAALRELIDAFGVVATEYEGKAAEVVRDIPYSFFLEEHLAGDDEEKLARLEAIRDARGD